MRVEVSYMKKIPLNHITQKMRTIKTTMKGWFEAFRSLMEKLGEDRLKKERRKENGKKKN